MTDKMDFADGKYTVLNDNGKLSALRYGEPWRDMTGDNLIYWMMVDAQRLKEQRDKLLEALKRIVDWDAAGLALTEPVKQCMAHGECFGGECIYQRPAEPVQEPWKHLKQYGYAPGDYMSRCRICGELAYDVDKRAITCRPCAELRYAESQKVQEPVAVVRSVVGQGDDGVRIKWLSGFPQVGDRLYTAPFQRKPLPEDEVRDLLEEEFLGEEGRKRSWNDDLRVFRAAERAHNIT